MSYPKSIRMFEAGARDGLQSIKATIPLEVKVGLIDRLTAAGLQAIEAGAFVSPKWVPQMADSAEVLERIDRKRGVYYPVLTPNMKGYEAALAAGVGSDGMGEIGIFGAASESFSQKNINAGIEESLARFEPVARAATDAGIRARGYVSCVLGCPYEGEIAPSAVAEVAARLHGMGCYEISLGDTIGTGTPGKARAMMDAVVAAVPDARLGLHFHDTWGQALANILACLDYEISSIDSSAAGLGGCPYAPGAAGNVASEDVLYMLDGLGIETGVDMEKLAEAGRYVMEHLGRVPPSKAAQALAARSARAETARA